MSGTCPQTSRDNIELSECLTELSLLTGAEGQQSPRRSQKNSTALWLLQRKQRFHTWHPSFSNLFNLYPRKEFWSECHNTHFCTIHRRPTEVIEHSILQCGSTCLVVLFCFLGFSQNGYRKRSMSYLAWWLVLPKQLSKPFWLLSFQRKKQTWNWLSDGKALDRSKTKTNHPGSLANNPRGNHVGTHTSRKLLYFLEMVWFHYSREFSPCLQFQEELYFSWVANFFLTYGHYSWMVFTCDDCSVHWNQYVYSLPEIVQNCKIQVTSTDTTQAQFIFFFLSLVFLNVFLHLQPGIKKKKSFLLQRKACINLLEG